MFDHDYSSALDTNELTMAMKRNLGLTITQEQAEAVVRFYDRKNAGQMSYQLLLEDVVRGQPLMLQHPELSARTIARTRDSLRSNPFVPTPFKPAPNKMVDIFRTNVRRSLDNIIRYKGGSVKSWLSKSFVAWDPQFSGFISDWRALQGSVRKLGVNISEDDAKVIMHTYDRLGDGRMDYNYLAQDILSCDPLFIVDSTSVMDLKRTATARAPPNISALVRRFKRAAEVYTRKSEGSVSARDILHGTFLRMDSSRSGHISAEELQHVCAELKVPINQEEVRQLVLWFDSNGTETMDYVLLISQLFGEDVLTRPLSLPAVGLAATQMTDSDPNAIKESLRQKALKKIQRNKLLVTERVKVKAKLEAIEKQRQALVDHKRMNQSK
jgi:Ca2+-binding EF-hand superfamily protein